uniref:LIM/homeobox protein Lhx9 n=1 Tax=Ascaris suum TaxID=6253 RepID=F1L4V9_ASCSU
MRAREAVFHLRCFTCIVCSAPLHPGELFAMGEHGTLYCQGHYEPVNAASSECPLIRTEPTEVRFGRGKTRCRKGKKTSEDGENGSDNIDYCDDEVLTQSGRSKRMRTSFKHHQLRTMKSYFNLNHNPDAKDLKQLAQRTGLTKRVLQVWFQNARAKFRRNTMQGREGESISPHVSRVSSIPSNEQAAGSGSASLGGGSARTSSSPEEVSQRASSAYEQSSSPTERIDETVMKSEDGAPNVDSPAKTLAEYFESDPALL